ncbi:intercellular adhesin biosynthesis polysaccharide N-deacetylase [Macrococcus lamae]|uniref:Poly-beta-1,6-N-acetyl-D-glucosamine N-deacetylase n=2 Tax=Macrococcus lamae TaxID=198484 RepID=A0A4R6BV62_9STAP|nr:intercellular adhesin biosynthesis polysaccharide N-deacetylase [Macrococcus lamae]
MSKDKNSCLALNYHRVRQGNLLDTLLMIFSNSKELKNYSVTNKELGQQLKWLKEQDANFVTLDEFTKYKKAGKFPAKCVWINFDDMDSSIYKYGQPVLKEYNVPATGFVITGEVGNDNFHNLQMSDTEELKKMKDSGLWTFATHTNKLHTLTKEGSIFVKPENRSKVQVDIQKSIDYLHREFNEDVTAIAYPYGQINDETIDELKQTPIKYGFTLQEQSVTKKTDNMKIPRILVNNSSFEEVVKKWEGFK